MNGPSAGRSAVGYMFVTTRTRTPRTLPARVSARIRHTFVTGTRRSVAGPRRTLQTVPRMVPGTSLRRSEMYELLGRAHAAAVRERGQGTVEYVGLILLLAAVLAVVVAAGKNAGGADIAKSIVGKLKDAIDNVGGGNTPSTP